MACGLTPRECRSKHIAAHLRDADLDGEDFEAHCPCCGHGGFRISKAKARKYRNVWTCACGRCHCNASALRAALLGLGIPLECLGVYDGPVPKNIPPEVARNLDLAVRDIFAVPHMRPADMRLVLAEAQGRNVPEVFKPFVKFAVSIGIGTTQAKEAAARWCRPPDSRPPQTGGAVVDTSRSTDANEDVKRPRSGRHRRSETDQRTVGNRPTGITDTRRSDTPVTQNVRRSETGQRTLGDESHLPPAA